MIWGMLFEASLEGDDGCARPTATTGIGGARPFHNLRPRGSDFFLSQTCQRTEVFPQQGNTPHLPGEETHISTDASH